MKLEDFRRMKAVGQKTLGTEANLDDMSEVTLREYDEGRARFQVDERNRRFRRVEGGQLGPWEALEG